MLGGSEEDFQTERRGGSSQENGTNCSFNCKSIVGLMDNLLTSHSYSVVVLVSRPTSLFARVRLDIRATYAGRSKKAAATVVSTHLVVYSYTDRFLFAGRHHTRVKDEPASPAKATGKRKMYSANGSNPIGTIEQLNEADIPQGGSKRQKTSAGATAHVRFDGATATTSTRPTPRPTRKSTRSAKATPKIEDNSKLEINELFAKLGKEFYAIGKACENIGRTCENIAETIN